jgi:cell division septal protein FtsQ
MRLGPNYELAVAREKLPMRATGRTRVTMGPKLASLLLASVLLSALAYFFVSDSFYVYEATVLGSTLVSADEMMRQTNMEGFSIFFMDPEELEEAISRLPDIRKAEVQLRLPNRMMVNVRERQALVVWETGQERYGVDDEGTVVSLPTEREPSVVIRDLDSIPRVPGEHLDLDIIAAAEKYQALLPGYTEFGYSQHYGLSLENEHGWRIHLGGSEGAEVKVAIMRALVESLESQGAVAEFVDLRFPDSPHYRLAGGANAEP